MRIFVREMVSMFLGREEELYPCVRGCKSINGGATTAASLRPCCVGRWVVRGMIGRGGDWVRGWVGGWVGVGCERPKKSDQ